MVRCALKNAAQMADSGLSFDSRSVSLVVLTMGERPAELGEAIRSASDQSSISWNELVVIWNGAEPIRTAPVVRDVWLRTNVGIPGGRNIGVSETSGGVVVFLDDDARFTSTESISLVMDMFEADPRLGAVAFRVVDETGTTSRRHVPRLGARHATVRGEVAQFLGGAVAIRRRAFEDAGGYPGEFFYAMEESDLAMGMIDKGWTIRYEPAVEVFHPKTEPARHAGHTRHTARNRVLMARRRLPVLVGVVYVANWLVITAARERASWPVLKALIAGTRDGLRMPVERVRITWRTVWALTRLGRPPIV